MRPHSNADQPAVLHMTGTNRYIREIDRLVFEEGHRSRVALFESAISAYARERGITLPPRLETKCARVINPPINGGTFTE